MSSVTPLRPKDPTAAKRAKNYRNRRKQSAVMAAPSRHGRRDGVTVAVTVAALALATVAGTFSIIGLTHIFAGAFWPIIGMGCAIEFGKVAAVMFMGRHRHAAPLAVKTVLVVLIATLMALNAIGAYGYLAASHIGHAVAGDAAIAARAADVNARQQVQVAALADVDKRIGQIDAAVNEATRRGRTASAMALLEQETARRKDLVAARISAANTVAALHVEAAQVEGERAAVKADSGPVHYIAAIIGADDEAVMRYFILLVAGLLDPLAVVLLLAATAARRQS